VRLDLGHLYLPRLKFTIPVHGFLVKHPSGAGIIDTGYGSDTDLIKDYRAVNAPVAAALRKHDVDPSDIRWIINSHLHFDHCGQNAVFKHAPSYVQRAELRRMRRESPDLYHWFDFMNARFELLDGDAEVLPGLEVIATPGHTEGHQCVVVRGGNGSFDLLIGDAAYTPRQYADPASERLPAGQASDVPVWRDTVRRIQSLRPERVHFCHHTDIVHR